MTWHSDHELDCLDAALMALPQDNDPMLLTEFDGFCAGLITCPEVISPSAWLKHVWGSGGMPEFKDLAEMQVMIDLIMAHYNRVAALLMMQGEYYPVMDEDRRNGDILWEFWMMGFVAAMRLRPEAWAGISRSGNVRAINALKKMEELAEIGVAFSEGKRPKSGMLIKQAPTLIPDLVEDLNHFAKAQPLGLASSFPLAANMTTAPARPQKVGRNDPCPCGSGKKYKKCCGAGRSPL